MNFGEKLIKKRRERGMTQDELALELGVSRQSVSKWENGECLPEADKLIRLADILDVSLDELTGREARAAVPTDPAQNEPASAESAEKPKLRYAVIAAAALVFGALCFLAGRYLLPYYRTAEPVPTENPTAVPTANVTEAPTPAPTAAPTAVLTAEPVPPDSRFIDEAWDAAKSIAAMYGVDFLMKESWGIDRGDGWLNVHFGVMEHSFAYIEARFIKDTASHDGWRMDKCYAYVPGEEDFQRIFDDRAAFGNYFEFEVSVTELAEAGHVVTGTDADLEAAARLVLDRFAKRFRELDEDDLMRCRDAKAVGLELRVFDPSTGWYAYDAAVAVYPYYHRSFTLGFTEATAGWLYLGDEHPECRYYVELNMRIGACWNEDMRSIAVSVDLPEPI